MSSRRKATGQPAPSRPRSMPLWFLPVAAAVVVLGVVVFLLLPRSGGAQTAWTRFDTQDVHSLSFVGGDPERLLFGHHGGLFESRDGGRSWAPLPVRDDAMSMAPADDGSIVIAGHPVFTASRDGGLTWAPIATDLPSLAGAFDLLLGGYSDRW